EGFRGKILYAGGDDLLAMVPVEDLLPLMLALRCAYSGTAPSGDEEALWQLLRLERQERFKIGRGFVQLRNGRLVRTMGARATCSMGAVVAHHMTPLGAALRDLRSAERRAKDAGRDAFCITLAKRAGGTTHLTSGFHVGGAEGHQAPNAPPTATPMGVLLRLQEAFGRARQAAYRIRAWAAELPRDPGVVADQGEMLASVVHHQLVQSNVSKDEATNVARDLAAVVLHEAARRERRTGEPADPVELLDRFVGHAEFLARPERGPSVTGEDSLGEEAAQ
ncbi:MAG: hypothetical protein ACOC9O_03780, partial [Myxococcota bacterium]